MTDHLLEEQEMEAEALAAIFPDAFEIRSSTQPFVWSIKLVPIDTGGDKDLDEKQNFVGVRLVATIPLNYPEEVGPELDVEIIKVRNMFSFLGSIFDTFSVLVFRVDIYYFFKSFLCLFAPLYLSQGLGRRAAKYIARSCPGNS